PISSAQSIYANPTKDANGELQIQQNFARVGSKEIDDLMDKAEETLDQNEAFDLINQADTLVWNEVHSITFYQRPQMNGVNKNLANVGSYGFAQPDYTKIGFMSAPSGGAPPTDVAAAGPAGVYGILTSPDRPRTTCGSLGSGSAKDARSASRI